MKKAVLYRMLTAQHVCPYGIRSKHVLKQQGYAVEDHILKTREEVEAFKKEHAVKTTPQTFIKDQRIGGYDDLLDFFKLKSEKKAYSYQPIAAVFAMTFLMAMSVQGMNNNAASFIKIAELFVALSMCVLAILKLRDLEAFINQFITYDLVAIKSVPYAYAYPFAEACVGLSMLAGSFMLVAAPVAFVMGLLGAVSVIKAVYIDQRDLKCACVGGNSNVPLGLISLLENILMISSAIWMILTQA